MSKINPFCMPKWGIEMTEGTIAEWMVKEGDAFARGQTLALIETAKITNEVQAEYDAVVRRILVPAGGEAEAVGELLAVFADASVSDAEIDDFVATYQVAGEASARKSAKVTAACAPAPVTVSAVATSLQTNRPISPEALKLATREGADLTGISGTGRNGRITYQDMHQALRPAAVPAWRGALPVVTEESGIFASPLARRIAALHGVTLAGMAGTGPRGRISRADVLAHVSRPPAAGGSAFALVENHARVVPFDRIRKVVAQRLTAAKQDIPHFYLRTSASADALLAFRRTANLVLGSKASINDYIVKAAAIALAQHPEINVQVHGDALHRFRHPDIAIAVASPRGLMTPVVRQPDRMRIDQIASVTRGLIDKAEAGSLTYQDMEGGTFTVSNLGMFGIENFDAIINPPQAAILAVGAATRHPVEAASGAFAFETRIGFTLSVDHRAIDGASGARFLAAFRHLIEKPEDLFATADAD